MNGVLMLLCGLWLRRPLPSPPQNGKRLPNGGASPKGVNCRYRAGCTTSLGRASLVPASSCSFPDRRWLSCEIMHKQPPERTGHRQQAGSRLLCKDANWKEVLRTGLAAGDFGAIFDPHPEGSVDAAGISRPDPVLCTSCGFEVHMT